MMKITIWIVHGIFEGGRTSIALFLTDKKQAEIRQNEMDNDEDCLETHLVGFEIDITMEAGNKELLPFK